jgi:hypothetical protein
MTSCDDGGPLAPLFPRAPLEGDLLATPDALAVHALPTLVVLVAWLGFEAQRRRAPLPRAAKRQGAALGALAALALGLLAARTLDAAACAAGRAVSSSERVLAGALTALSVASLVLCIGPRLPRLTLLVLLVLAGGAVAADAALRRLDARAPLVPAQHLLLLCAVVLFGHLPTPTSSTRRRRGCCAPASAPAARAGHAVVDPLQHRRSEAAAAPSDRSWSWFAL